MARACTLAFKQECLPRSPCFPILKLDTAGVVAIQLTPNINQLQSRWLTIRRSECTTGMDPHSDFLKAGAELLTPKSRYISLVAAMCMVLYGYDAAVFNACQNSAHWKAWMGDLVCCDSDSEQITS